jgi:hypothetical protein
MNDAKGKLAVKVGRTATGWTIERNGRVVRVLPDGTIWRSFAFVDRHTPISRIAAIATGNPIE